MSEVADTKSIFEEKVNAMKSLIEEQQKYCVDNYQMGLYNGLVIGLSVLTGEEPKFYEKEE